LADVGERGRPSSGASGYVLAMAKGEERVMAINNKCQCQGSYTTMINGTYHEKGGFVWIIESLAFTYRWLCKRVGSINLGWFCQYGVE